MGNSNALTVRTYPRKTHCVVGRSVPKYSEIVGRATMVPPWSATDVKRPMEIAVKAHHL